MTLGIKKWLELARSASREGERSALELSSVKVCAREICVVEVRTAQVSISQHRVAKSSLVEHGVRGAGVLQRAAAQVGAIEICVLQSSVVLPRREVRTLQVRALEIRSFESWRVGEPVSEELLKVSGRQPAKHGSHDTQRLSCIRSATAAGEVADAELARTVEKPPQKDGGGQLLSSVVGSERSHDVVERTADDGQSSASVLVSHNTQGRDEGGDNA
jgi:hypothetical protein